MGVCADPHPEEGQKAGAGKWPGDARGLPQHLLRSRLQEVGNGSWKCREPARDGAASPRPRPGRLAADLPAAALPARLASTKAPRIPLLVHRHVVRVRGSRVLLANTRWEVAPPGSEPHCASGGVGASLCVLLLEFEDVSEQAMSQVGPGVGLLGAREHAEGARAPLPDEGVMWAWWYEMRADHPQPGCKPGLLERRPRCLQRQIPVTPGKAGTLCRGGGAGAQVGQGFELQQPQDTVSVTAGETLTLNCTTSSGRPAGPVKWLKGWGSGNQTVYGQTGSFPRVTRASDGSDTDFTIHIRDVQPVDAGTYYCVKFTKTGYGDEVFRRGKGTQVSVHGDQTHCAGGRTKSSYDMSSTVTLTLEADDVRSRLICEVRHPTLTGPLRGTYRLSQALRVSPSVRVVADPPSPVEVNKTVNFTCNVKDFYPGVVAVTWLENGTEMNVENVSRLVETPQGLFKLSSVVEIKAVEEKNESVFTCRVVHDSQAPIERMATLWITTPVRDGMSDASQTNNGNLLSIYIAVAVVCTVLALLVAAILYLIRVKQSKGKSSPSARLHEPEKSSEATTQESDPNNLTYADLNFERERKTIRRMVEMSQQSEYACIQTNRAPNGDDNLTYADLDMVHLSKAPKRPAPHPEEAGSEYASVQIPRK
ncbi:PREDICTED: tyrosine-protein phosphatase non-receptor type substrate 1-like [Charadrius vociferus]|uniref:tyrosine-protein phosphatase non-receptor type substrate 1-like n=1 Tax=Charadrius vociferus TaxID=50402 RepID=UPI000521A89E|nr:PREDICTED: tyrosine-protein phosphatase non-receptor type substrate 1-like [Charadrius vociferus]